jgi:CRP/FNR family transcriptional regulator
MQLLSRPSSNIDDELDVLRSLPMFSVVSEDEVGRALSMMKRRRYAKGEVVYRQDDPPGSLFIVIDGAVKMERALDDGRQHTIGWVTRGNFFGTHSLFGVVTRTENAIVVKACDLLVFGGPEFRAYLQVNPSAMEALLEVVITKWRGTLDRFSESVLLDVRERTVRVLVRLMSQMGVENGDGRVHLPDLTQPELASWVGSSRESVNRALRWLADMGIIGLQAGKVCILDQNRLIQMDDGKTVI